MEVLELVPYGKGFAVFGNTKDYRQELKDKGFKYNANLTRDGEKTPGWIVAGNKEADARKFVDLVNKGKVKKTEETSYTSSKVSSTLERNYRELSSYTDLYIANKLSRIGEGVSKSARTNRYNLHVSMLEGGPAEIDLDPAFDTVFRSDVYSKVSEMSEIDVGKELGLANILLHHRATLFDGHMCLTALRMMNASDEDTPHAIKIVEVFDQTSAEKLKKAMPKKLAPSKKKVEESSEESSD